MSSLDPVEAYALAPQDEVSCYYCMGVSGPLFGDVEHYRRGEAVLAEAGHPPYDGNANYICLVHLNRDVVIYDPHDDVKPFRQVTVKEYAKLGRPEVVEEML